MINIGFKGKDDFRLEQVQGATIVLGINDYTTAYVPHQVVKLASIILNQFDPMTKERVDLTKFTGEDLLNYLEETSSTLGSCEMAL